MEELRIEYLPPDALKPYDRNARRHTERDIEAIKASIRENGFCDPVGIWGPDNLIVEGHGRILAAKDLGLEEIPCIRLDHLSEDQRREYALAHNRTAELSEWDEILRDEEIAALEDAFDMAAFGFDTEENDESSGDWFDREEKDGDDTEGDPDDIGDVERLETHYGVPYQGNKSRIADRIIAVLPPGDRLVDLFGGGGAITHCAMLSGKWGRFLYNDINEMITRLFLDAISGKYHDERRVITRKDFEENKDKDPYIKYIWSFGNGGSAYLWGKNIEDVKCQACRVIMAEDIRERRLEYRQLIGMIRTRECDTLDRLQSIEHLQALTQLEALQRLEALNIPYEQYEHQEGDVVYCDIPYEKDGDGTCDDYGIKFDSKKFYEWAKSRPYQVFFSSYEISDDSFDRIKVKSVHALMGANTNARKVSEYLYSNRPILELS